MNVCIRRCKWFLHHFKTYVSGTTAVEIESFPNLEHRQAILNFPRKQLIKLNINRRQLSNHRLFTLGQVSVLCERL